jgi:hypothetical protein
MPAIGDSTMGCSIPRRSLRFRSFHMASLLFSFPVQRPADAPPST